MIAAPPTSGEDRSISVRTTSRRRRLRNAVATAFCTASVVVVAVPLGLVVGYVVHKGAAVVDLGFFTEPIPTRARRPGPGMGPAVVGTLVITGFATLLAVPLGILAAVYLHEYGGRGPLARFLRFLANVMSGVPSIVMGLFIFTVWVLRTEEFSGLAGALALASLMLPIVIRSTEGMLRLVPNELREGAYALGCSKSRTIATVVLPAALPGITSGALLAVARAAGETAPLLFTIGGARSFNFGLTGTTTALSAQIFTNAQTGFPAAIDRAWGAALTLIGLVLVLSTIARLISARFTVR